MSVYFFTGFPGYIATSLVKDLLKSNHAVSNIYLLVLPQLQTEAEKRIQEISNETKFPAECLQIVIGDITQPDLGLDSQIHEELVLNVQYVYHLAAIYDLAVPQILAHQVNVLGTKHINDWILGINHLRRYVYFSTAYVSGTREGRIYENELAMNQQFKNYYEETKYQAELLVHQMMPNIPTTIIRPGIVMGHSQTGFTIKFDGPYFILNVFDRLKHLPIIPFMGRSQAIGNFVPLDYILSATLYLGHHEMGIGKVYHLTDPHAYPMQKVYEMLMVEYLGKHPKGTLPLSPIRFAMKSSMLRRWLRVEREAFDYFTYVTFYDTTQTVNDLKGSNIQLPDFKETIKPMVTFYRQHKDNPAYHIPIV